MSEDPPKLRLKPRLASETTPAEDRTFGGTAFVPTSGAGAGVTIPPAAVVTPDSSVGGESSQEDAAAKPIRLRPRLAGEAAAGTAAPSAEAAAAGREASAVPAAFSERVSPVAGAAPAEPAPKGKFSLKPKGQPAATPAAPAEPAAPALPAQEAVEGSGETGLRGPVPVPPPATAEFPPLATVQPVVAKPELKEEKPEEKRGFKIAIMAVMAVIVLVAVGAVVVIFKFTKKEMSPPAKPAVVAKTPAAAPKPAAASLAKPAPPPAPAVSAAASPAALPAQVARAQPSTAPVTNYGKAVAKARNSADAANQNEVLPANAVVKAAAPAAATGAVAAPGTKPVAPAPGVSASVVAAKPEVAAAVPAEPSAASAVVAPAASAVPPEPGVAFKAWASNLKSLGVIVRGGSARILIDRVAYNQDEVVNPQLGIVFVGYDAERRMVRFRDKTGATLERRDR